MTKTFMTTDFENAEAEVSGLRQLLLAKGATETSWSNNEQAGTIKAAFEKDGCDLSFTYGASFPAHQRGVEYYPRKNHIQISDSDKPFLCLCIRRQTTPKTPMSWVFHPVYSANDKEIKWLADWPDNEFRNQPITTKFLFTWYSDWSSTVSSADDKWSGYC